MMHGHDHKGHDNMTWMMVLCCMLPLLALAALTIFK